MLGSITKCCTPLPTLDVGFLHLSVCGATGGIYQNPYFNSPTIPTHSQQSNAKLQCLVLVILQSLEFFNYIKFFLFYLFFTCSGF